MLTNTARYCWPVMRTTPGTSLDSYRNSTFISRNGAEAEHFKRIQTHHRCITVLYKFGYRVALPDGDKTTIKRVLETEDAVINDWYFYYTLYLGNSDGNTAGIKLKADKSEISQVQSCTTLSGGPWLWRDIPFQHLSSYNVPYSQEHKEISKVRRPCLYIFF